LGVRARVRVGVRVGVRIGVRDRVIGVGVGVGVGVGPRVAEEDAVGVGEQHVIAVCEQAEREGGLDEPG
jgi:hypothetical protein